MDRNNPPLKPHKPTIKSPKFPSPQKKSNPTKIHLPAYLACSITALFRAYFSSSPCDAYTLDASSNSPSCRIPTIRHLVNCILVEIVEEALLGSHGDFEIDTCCVPGKSGKGGDLGGEMGLCAVGL